MKKYYVYILSGQTYGPVFIETTSDLMGRMKAHRVGHLSENSFRIDQLVHIEQFDSSIAANARKAALKSASREWIDALIERDNPNWSDMLAPVKADARRAA